MKNSIDESNSYKNVLEKPITKLFLGSNSNPNSEIYSEENKIALDLD
jgi:hypothetical protein